MDNFNIKKFLKDQYLAEGKLLKEDMTSKAVSVLKSYKGEVEGVEGYIKYLMNTSDDISSSIQAIADDLDRDKPSSDSLRRDLEKLSLAEGKILKEGIPQESEIADYVEAMFNDSVVEKEGFQSDVWTKAEYAATSRDEGSVFMDLAKHLNSVGGKDVLEGNPDIKLELLPNGDIKWSANVTFD